MQATQGQTGARGFVCKLWLLLCGSCVTPQARLLRYLPASLQDSQSALTLASLALSPLEQQLSIVHKWAQLGNWCRGCAALSSGQVQSRSLMSSGRSRRGAAAAGGSKDANGTEEGTLQTIREATGAEDDDIKQTLVECGGDVNEAVSRLIDSGSLA